MEDKAEYHQHSPMLAALEFYVEVKDVAVGHAAEDRHEQAQPRPLQQPVVPQFEISLPRSAVFGSDVDYAQLQKIYGAPAENDTRYSPATCIGCEMKEVSGRPNPKHVSTSYVERHNLTVRMGMWRFTRLTNGFSKKIQNHAAMVAIHAVYYNFARIHKTLRITPAMAADLSDHVWSLEEIVTMADDYIPKPGKRGPYNKRIA